MRHIVEDNNKNAAFRLMKESEFEKTFLQMKQPLNKLYLIRVDVI